jgi:hypothetical protein
MSRENIQHDGHASQSLFIVSEPLPSVAASLRGLYLGCWRYGSETEQLIEEALDQESWSPSQWKVCVRERLAYVLHGAPRGSWYYRE